MKDYISEFLEEILGVESEIDIDCCDHDLSVWEYVREKKHDGDYSLYDLAEQYEELMRYFDQNEYPPLVRESVCNTYSVLAEEIFLKFDDEALKDDVDDLIANARAIEEEYASMRRRYDRERF